MSGFDPATHARCNCCGEIYQRDWVHVCPMPVQTGTCKLCGNPIFEGIDHVAVCRYRFKPNLRDQLAMAALTGYMTGVFMADVNEGLGFIGNPNIAEAARDAYRYADAMLKAREK